MDIILLTWEFPPRIIGQISRDAEEAATELAKRGHRVDVVTFHDHLVGMEQRAEGLRVHRVSNPVRSQVNIVTWGLALNTELQRVAADVILETQSETKLVHAFEWLCVPAAIQLKKALRVPYLLSVYSLESERSPGGELSGAISYFERIGCEEASKIIVKSKTRAELLQKLYSVPQENIKVLDVAGRWFDDLLEQYRIALANVVSKPQLQKE